MAVTTKTCEHMNESVAQCIGLLMCYQHAMSRLYQSAQSVPDQLLCMHYHHDLAHGGLIKLNCNRYHQSSVYYVYKCFTQGIDINVMQITLYIFTK